MTRGLPDDVVDVYARRVQNGIEHCIRAYMNIEQTMERLWRQYKIPCEITSTMWRDLEQTNPNFFEDYSLRLLFIHQIEKFNILLELHARTRFQIMNQPPPCLDNYNWSQAQVPPLLDQNYSNHTDRVMKYPNMIPSVASAVPRDSSNTMDVLHYSTLNSNLPYGSSDDNFMQQNYPSDISSTFCGSGSVPQLPMMYDYPLPFSNIEVQSFNIEDESGTLTQDADAFGGLTINESPSTA